MQSELNQDVHIYHTGLLFIHKVIQSECNHTQFSIHKVIYRLQVVVLMTRC